MENSTNKYLHKKFKKQFGEIRISQQEENLAENYGIKTKESIINEKIHNVINVVSEQQQQEQQEVKNDDNSHLTTTTTTIDNNNSSSNVPNESTSTNNLLLYNVNSNEKSSISSSQLLASKEATIEVITGAVAGISAATGVIAAGLTATAAGLITVTAAGITVTAAEETVTAAGSTNVIKVNVIKKNEQNHYQHQEEQSDEFRSKNVQIMSGDIATNPQTTTTTTNGSISNIFSKVEGQINDNNFDINFKLNEPKHAKSSITTNNVIISNPTTTATITNQTHIITQNLEPYYVNATTTTKTIVEDISTTTSSITSSTSSLSYDNLKTTTPTNLTISKPQIVVNENNQIIEKSPNGKYVCQYCNLVCSKPSVLQKHIRAHTNERPYPCESCGSRFKTRSNLYKHCRSRTHANRVMGNNKTIDNNNDADLDNQIKYDYYNNSKMMNEMNDINNRLKIDNNLMLQENQQEQQHHQQIISTTIITSSTQHDAKPKPYKPRFHTKSFYDNLTKENMSIQDEQKNSKTISSHINELITKNHYIVNTENYYPANKCLNNENVTLNNKNNSIENYCNNIDEPLNLSSKSRKRCLSEVAEPSTQKSLIKELLLKNLYASTDMQCANCKMIFQTVTELDVHKHRSNCKGYNKTGGRYNRSSSVNVASILTQNKNAFDGMPQLQDTFFPLKSPGPFLGKTRLIESDKNKSFSFEDGIQNSQNDFFRNNYKNLSISSMECSKRPAPVKLFGGEVKITHTSGETKSFKVDSKETESFLTNNPNVDYGSKLSENTVVKSVLQSGGTVLQNKTNYSSNKKPLLSPVDVMNYQSRSVSPNYHVENGKYSANMEIANSNNVETRVPSEYTSIMDFSQKAANSFTPNLKQLNLTIPGVPIPNILPKPPSIGHHLDDVEMKMPLPPGQNKEKLIDVPTTIGKDFRLHSPMTLVVNGKMVPYVPGMPGPITAEVHFDSLYRNNIHPTHIPIPTFKLTPAEQTEQLLGTQTLVGQNLGAQALSSRTIENQTLVATRSSPQIVTGQPHQEPIKNSPVEKSIEGDLSPTKKLSKYSTSTTSIQETPKKFARPNSLALKPTIASLKQHHGLTPTVFNQILISPDTPRVAKKYIEYQRNGYYFSNLGLKSSTKSVYCTLNKTQPYYVPHYKKLSMYSEWRQQDTKADKLYVSAYDSRQKQEKYTVAGHICKPFVVHSSYKFFVSKSYNRDENKANSQITGGHESNEKYTYIRGRGRGRYVCDQCGIRCKKPSMLKKHIRTHTNDRPYTCNHCNFSFKTKGNLTKHMKCKSHNKNYYASSCSSGTFNQPSSTPTSESDTDDSGMDSSDESTRQHEAAYGLLSLSQKPSTTEFRESSPNENIFSIATTSKDNNIMDDEEIVHVSKQTFAKNKILDQQPDNLNFSKKFNNIMTATTTTTITMSIIEQSEGKNVNLYLGKSDVNVNRPLTYPYTSPLIANSIVNIDKAKLIDKENYSLPDVDDRIDDDDDDDEIDDDEEMIYESNDDPKEYITLDKQNTLREISPLPKETSSSSNSKRIKFIISNENTYDLKTQKQDVVMDLSVNSSSNKENGDVEMMELESEEAINYSKVYPTEINKNNVDSVKYDVKRSHYPPHHQHQQQHHHHQLNDCYTNTETVRFIQNGDTNYISEDSSNDTGKIYKRLNEYDNSAMETLADIATKQMKLEKNSIAKNVATEFLKLATKNDGKVLDSLESNNFINSSKDVNDLIAKREENKSCTICSKNFSKPSQLRLHMNIHYLERPFRCDSCSVGFRTKGLLQKHERSAGHHNKLSTSPALSSSEPRPFKCSDCNVAFRIHGHLAKHLRSKMHIMKLECLAKIPFGLYAELERSNSLLTEINTSDGEQCLESLKNLAKKVFVNDPNKMNQTNKGSSSVI